MPDARPTDDPRSPRLSPGLAEEIRRLTDEACRHALREGVAYGVAGTTAVYWFLRKIGWF